MASLDGYGRRSLALEVVQIACLLGGGQLLGIDLDHN